MGDHAPGFEPQDSHAIKADPQSRSEFPTQLTSKLPLGICCEAGEFEALNTREVSSHPPRERGPCCVAASSLREAGRRGDI